MKKTVFILVIIISSILVAACILAPSEILPHDNINDPLHPDKFHNITITKTGAAEGEDVVPNVTETIMGTEVTLTAILNENRIVNISGNGLTIDHDYLTADSATARFIMPEIDTEVTAIFKSSINFENILHASDMQADDLFGTSTSISGQYAIVGAQREDKGTGDPVVNAGAAYIYKDEGIGVWTEKSVLYASDAQMGDRFGISVSISGNYAIVGAFRECGGDGDPTTSAGAAYIFKNDGQGNWTQTTILHASDAQTDDCFGVSVCISGDYAIVGARNEDGGLNNPIEKAGAAYTFKNHGDGVWSQVSVLHASDAQADDCFGYSVSISGNYAIVGAKAADGENPEDNTGAAYIFKRDEANGLWTELALLGASDAKAFDIFGVSVGICGNNAIVGASFEDGGAGDPHNGSGAAYIFTNDGNDNWTETAILHASDAQSEDQFGSSVAISEDYAMVGADKEDGGDGNPADNAGAAYIFNNNGDSTWTEMLILHAGDADVYDEFGVSVGISGDSAIIGSYCEDGGAGDPASAAGAAYIFSNLR
ncbi:MAG: FG-GAP repeat protein [Spirochaetales bacterium]|nr:FG-GAP repeat protein [Spirochaetales bacterium]